MSPNYSVEPVVQEHQQVKGEPERADELNERYAGMLAGPGKFDAEVVESGIKLDDSGIQPGRNNEPLRPGDGSVVAAGERAGGVGEIH